MWYLYEWINILSFSIVMIKYIYIYIWVILNLADPPTGPKFGRGYRDMQGIKMLEILSTFRWNVGRIKKIDPRHEEHKNQKKSKKKSKFCSNFLGLWAIWVYLVSKCRFLHYLWPPASNIGSESQMWAQVDVRVDVQNI